MKRFLVLAIFLFQISSVFADSFTDTYPSQIYCCWVLKYDWVLNQLGYVGKDNELTKVFKDVNACLEERISTNLEKDIEKCGLYFVQGETGFDFMVVVSGKFKIDTYIDIIKKEILPKAKPELTKLENFKIGNKEVKALKDDSANIIFYSNEIIIIAKDGVYNALQKNMLTFNKAPQAIDDMLKKSNSFIYIAQNAVMFLSMLGLPPEVIGGVQSIIAYIENDLINIEFTCNDSNTVEQIKTELEKKRKEYSTNYSNEFNQKKKELNEAGIDKLPSQIALMYSSAKGKDFIDDLKFSANGNAFVIQTKADASVIVPGITGLVVPIAMAFAPMLTKGMGGTPGLGGPSSSVGGNRDEAIKRSCFSNQRVITGAIEMYNMDYDTPMKTLDMETLLNQNYMKPVTLPDPQCKYESVGDISSDGYINCTLHGSIANQ